MFLSPGTLTPSDPPERVAARVRAARAARGRGRTCDAVSWSRRWTARTTASSAPSSRCRPARLADYENILARLRGLPRLYRSGDRADGRAARRRAGAARRGRGPDARPGGVAAAPAGARLAAARGVLHVPRVDARQHAAAAARRRRVAAYPQQFVPSWTRLETLPARSLPAARARRRSGFGAAPDGPAAYAQLVRYFTTTRMSPDEIHQLGLQGGGSDRARDAGDRRRVRLHRAACRSSSASWPAGRACKFESEAEMLAYAEDVLASLQPAMPKLFLRAAAGRGARAADSARPRRVDAVQLHAPAPRTGRARRGST